MQNHLVGCEAIDGLRLCRLAPLDDNNWNLDDNDWNANSWVPHAPDWQNMLMMYVLQSSVNHKRNLQLYSYQLWMHCVVKYWVWGRKYKKESSKIYVLEVKQPEMRTTSWITRSWLGANFPGQRRLQGVVHCNGDHWRRRRLFYALPSHLNSAASSSASASAASAPVLSSASAASALFSDINRAEMQWRCFPQQHHICVGMSSDPTRLAWYAYMTSHCTTIVGPRTNLRAWILVSENSLCNLRVKEQKSHCLESILRNQIQTCR